MEEKDKIINYLNYNIALEHAAITQYLFHAFTICEESVEKDLEEIAREEMKHLRMFAHAVVDLGGYPAIDNRAEVFLEAQTKESLLSFDVEAEKMAINVYEKQLKDIKDTHIRKIFERVIQDESSHLHIFQALVEKLKENLSTNKEGGHVDENKAKIAHILNSYLKKQYQKILESLYQSFMLKAKNPKLSDTIEQRAIDKMKHFGWVAEEISEAGIKPNIDLPDIEKIENQEQAINYNTKDQEMFSKEVEDIAKNTEDSDLRWILDRISKREIHYEDLQEYLNNPNTPEQDIAKVITALTVGSLFGKNK